MQGGYNPHMAKIHSSSFLRFLPALLLWVIPALQLGCSGDKTSSEHVFELRAGSTVEVDGWDRTDVIIGGSRVWMAPKVAVDDDMVETVEKTVDDMGRPALIIRLDPEGTAKLERLSVQQLSRPIVVLVDGDPTSAPIVQSPLKIFMITANGLTEEEVDDLARRLEHDKD